MYNAANNASSQLAQAISASDTSLTVLDGSSFPEPPFVVSIEDEIIEVRAKNGNTFSALVRGTEGTTPASHASGSRVENRFTAGTYQRVVSELDAHMAENVSQVGGVHGLIYEEGTWTPTLEGATVAGVQTYSKREGSYIRINNIVTVFFWVILTAKDPGTIGTLNVAGLPFKPLGVGQNNGVSFGRISGTNLADPYTSIVAHAAGDPKFSLFKVGQNIFESLSIGDIADNFQILGSLTYKI